MARTTANRPYGLLAEYYDQLFTFHLSWYEAARQRVLGGILANVESACDLACGTGTTALELARRGIKMCGVDLSPTMCRLAREKSRRLGLPLRVIRGDMRHFRLPEPVDLVLCEFDALNHVERKGDLALAGRAVSRALRPGGYFYFDVNNRLAFETIWPGTWWVEKPGLAVVMHHLNQRFQVVQGGTIRCAPDQLQVIVLDARVGILLFGTPSCRQPREVVSAHQWVRGVVARAHVVPQQTVTAQASHQGGELRVGQRS